ncbi:hypothetical protein AKJ16_DCAP08943 [Drosera capensis]
MTETIDTFDSDLHRPTRASSFRFPLSKSRTTTTTTFLFSDSIPAESNRFLGYERLSQSTRFADDESPPREEKGVFLRGRKWGFLTRVFSFKKLTADSGRSGEGKMEKTKKKTAAIRIAPSSVDGRKVHWPLYAVANLMFYPI